MSRRIELQANLEHMEKIRLFACLAFGVDLIVLDFRIRGMQIAIMAGGFLAAAYCMY